MMIVVEVVQRHPCRSVNRPADMTELDTDLPLSAGSARKIKDWVFISFVPRDSQSDLCSCCVSGSSFQCALPSASTNLISSNTHDPALSVKDVLVVVR